MSKIKSRGRKNSAGRVYIAIIMTFLVIVLAVQVAGFKNKKNEYIRQERALAAELTSLTERAQDLALYEEYVQTNQYKEDMAKSKLGLTYENEIIFREQ